VLAVISPRLTREAPKPKLCKDPVDVICLAH